MTLGTQSKEPGPAPVGPGAMPPEATPGAAPGAAAAQVSASLDDAATGRFHRRAVLVSGVGFFTDAYDLFVISTVATLVGRQWNLSVAEMSWVTGSAIFGAFFGAFLFGRLADLLGRKRIYLLVAAIMVAGALASAVATGIVWLVAARFVLGLGIGGDYPVSAVMMSEFSNRRDRGRLVGLVFSMQAVGLVVGPLVALALLGSGIGHDLTWRLLLAFGALPAGAVIYMRAKIPESPRFQAHVQGEVAAATHQLEVVSADASARRPAALAPVPAPGSDGSPARRARPRRTPIRQMLRDPHTLALVAATAGTWFLFDYAYYGNTLSLPAILDAVDPGASLMVELALTLAMFVAFAVPGYALAVLRMDRIGHRRLQLIGFAVMATAFLLLGAVPALTHLVAPFVIVFGVSYFFIEFGPNTTTFVLPSEVFATDVRATGHGLAAGIGKLGAFVGVFLVPVLQRHIGLRGMLVVAGTSAVLGCLLTLVLPEPAGRSLEAVSGELAPSRLEEIDPAPARRAV